MNGKQVLKILKDNGWIVKEIRGSHYQLIKDGVKVPVPVHGTQDLKPGTLSAIEKQTGVKLK